MRFYIEIARWSFNVQLFGPWEVSLMVDRDAGDEEEEVRTLPSAIGFAMDAYDYDDEEEE